MDKGFSYFGNPQTKWAFTALNFISKDMVSKAEEIAISIVTAVQTWGGELCSPEPTGLYTHAAGTPSSIEFGKSRSRNLKSSANEPRQNDEKQVQVEILFLKLKVEMNERLQTLNFILYMHIYVCVYICVCICIYMYIYVQLTSINVYFV